MIIISEKISIDIDVYPAMRKLEAVEEERQEVEERVEETEKSSMDSFNIVMGMARTTWIMTSNIIRAAGGTINTVFRLMIQTALSSAQILYPLLTAQAMTPMGYLQAAVGFVNLGLMLAAVEMAKGGQEEVTTQFRAAQYALMSVSNLIGYAASL